ncbi:MAG: hypothetical protein WEB30_04190 [Cyclobacteriaceae bacterium]
MKILLFCLFSVITYCAYPQECFLIVSSGGGITGMATVYQVSPDGEVLKGRGLGQIDYSEKSIIQKSVARKYYRKTRKLVEKSPAFDHPGNIYYSLAARENGKEVKMTWGAIEYPAPEQAKNLYDEIIKILTGLTFTANTTK